jgi:hypothetical protein
MGHYANECLKKKEKAKQVATNIVARVDEDSSWHETASSMVSCLSYNTILSVGWYVDNRASRDMTCYNIIHFYIMYSN